jgi:hypothetical protein
VGSSRRLRLVATRVRVHVRMTCVRTRHMSPQILAVSFACM